MSAIDNLTPVPDLPQISEGNKTFSQKTFSLWNWIIKKHAPALVESYNLIVNSVTGAFSGVSATSVTIVDTGEVSINTDTGRSFKPGTPVRLAYVTDPRIYIDGITKTYNASTGAFIFYAQAKAGSGTYADWSLTIIPSGGGVAGLGSNTFVGDQFVPDDSYDATGWNGNNSVPTKSAIRDKIESLALIESSPYQSPARLSGVTYLNSTGRTIKFSCQVAYTSTGYFVVNVDTNNLFNIGNSSGTIPVYFEIPDGSEYSYTVTGGASVSYIRER